MHSSFKRHKDVESLARQFQHDRPSSGQSKSHQTPEQMDVDWESTLKQSVVGFEEEPTYREHDFDVKGKHQAQLVGAVKGEGLKEKSEQFRYSKKQFNVYDLVEVDDKELNLADIDSDYVNRQYLTIFLKYKLFKANVQYTLLKLRTQKRDSEITREQFRELLDNAYQKIGKINSLVASIVDVFEQVVAKLFVVKFSVMFNYYYKQFAPVRAEEELEEEATRESTTKSNFVGFLDTVSDQVLRECFAKNTNVEEFFTQLKNEFLELYRFDSAQKESKTVEPEPSDANILRFFDADQKYAGVMIKYFKKLTDSNTYFIITDVKNIVSRLLEMMNLQMHMILKARIITMTAEDVPQSYVNYWMFAVLSAWVICDYRLSSVMFADNCDMNYIAFVNSLQGLTVGDDEAQVVNVVRKGLVRLNSNRKAVFMGDENQLAANYGPFVAKLVVTCAERLNDLIEDVNESEPAQWSKVVYKYCFQYINGVDTQYGVEHFAMKENLGDTSFHTCAFNDFESSTKKQPCNYWINRDQIQGILERNASQDCQSVIQLMKDVNELDTTRHKINQQHSDWLNMVSQKRSPSSFNDEFPYTYAINESEDYVTDNQSLLVDLLEMHVDIVMSVWVMYINSLLRIVGTSVSYEDVMLATMIASCAQTANFGIEGSYDVLQFILDHVVR